jgi:predicted aldo/keto reductase-like oxidoreductase
MQKRTLGNTGLELSVIGFGGFHLVEVPRVEAAYLLNAYLDGGGSYVETAAQYGDGVSEKKIGEAISSRRQEFVLATKTVKRTRAEAIASLEQSLRNLKTDYVDIFFMHEPQTVREAKSILEPGGAMEAVLELKASGKVRFTGVSGHGRPAGIDYSVRNHHYDVLMTGFNYFDRFNFPQIENELLPFCLRTGTGVLGMKALADGYLFADPQAAIRYALSLPISSLVLGINSRRYLEDDLRIAESFVPMSEEEKTELLAGAPELGNYVCRLCEKCEGKNGLRPWEIFLLEGLYDRQMDGYDVPDPASYALRERLKFWFDQKQWAVREYGALAQKVDPASDYRSLNALCPYGIDIDRKLKITHSKLSEDGYVF